MALKLIFGKEIVKRLSLKSHFGQIIYQNLIHNVLLIAMCATYLQKKKMVKNQNAQHSGLIKGQ